MKSYQAALCGAVLGLASINAQANYPDLPVAIKNGAGAIIEDTLYVGLGADNQKFYALKLNEPNAAWQEIAAFPGGERNQPVASAIDGKLYVFGGLQKNAQGELQIINDAYRYTPQSNQWEKLATRSPVSLVGATAAAYQDKIYLVGGVNFAIFNGFFQDTVAAGDDAEKKAAITQAYLNQRPQDYFFNNELLSYQPATNQWHNEGTLPFSGRAGASFTIHNGELLVVNGEMKPGLRTPEAHLGKFVKDTVKWQNLPNLPSKDGSEQEGLAGAFAGFSHNHYVIAGGANFPGAQVQFKAGKLYAHEGLSKTWQSEIYTLDNGQWKILGKLPQGIAYGVAVSYGNKLLLVGGEGAGGQASKQIQTIEYDGKNLKIE